MKSATKDKIRLLLASVRIASFIFRKIQQFFLSLFTRDEKLLPDVAKAKLVVIYIQVCEVILSFTWL